MESDKVSVIIPSYNRFKYLLNAIESVKNQTHKNLEIIVINDKSTQEEYYKHDFGKDIILIHLDKNSKQVLGHGCAAYVRNEGMKRATGKYIAFLDDDDIWFPNKIELQLKAMEKTKCRMACTDGLIGNGIYDKNKTYKKYNGEHYYDILKSIYRRKHSKLLDNGFPEVWNLDFIKIHNCIICSSVIVERELLEKVNYMKLIRTAEDYDCWLKLLNLTNCVYIQDICFYYDNGHGDGINY
jgi:glycosyltransferase involved in cell wall biosynthesis